MFLAEFWTLELIIFSVMFVSVSFLEAPAVDVSGPDLLPADNCYFWNLLSRVPRKHEVMSFCDFEWCKLVTAAKAIVSLIGMSLASGLLAV